MFEDNIFCHINNVPFVYLLFYLVCVCVCVCVNTNTKCCVVQVNCVVGGGYCSLSLYTLFLTLILWGSRLVSEFRNVQSYSIG